MNLNSKNIELLIWKLAPAILTFLLFIFSIIPKHIWGAEYVMPPLPLISIFYWGRLQSTSLSYWFIFLIALLTDAVSGTPLGLSALLYLGFLAVLHAQSKYIHKEGFIIIWGYFIILTSTIIALQWLAMSFSGSSSHTALPAFIQLLLTLSCYPLFHKLFDRLAEHIKQRQWALSHG